MQQLLLTPVRNQVWQGEQQGFRGTAVERRMGARDSSQFVARDAPVHSNQVPFQLLRAHVLTPLGEQVPGFGPLLPCEGDAEVEAFVGVHLLVNGVTVGVVPAFEQPLRERMRLSNDDLFGGGESKGMAVESGHARALRLCAFRGLRGALDAPLHDEQSAAAAGLQLEERRLQVWTECRQPYEGEEVDQAES
ncbi:hypothetical protein [Myxococcus hansupus]|uniref:hypothetical protein n=1 Tax=Pseudomyxococcus hansupus TaxID=1297742 RepID=UPI0011876608|nr:hypothetical protein [Myxococcus hansupus]